ncbi:hypothetical protein MTX35_23300 [Rhodococcus sp. ARC_M12]|uniref:hypothetical protein n=1 Tax=unclassified Rhodococcus (in: high G+C Gram-positive bacteria) TaxID=192944 RepID=UPI001FB5574F|nr:MULTISPECIES: hypothetical protein [unclassified Rhodococcus (in: high G+C Gram-positive bacteria)]MCJ0980638.1 hypothetical protein [Rhodococcus sp. ARC_M12]
MIVVPSITPPVAEVVPSLTDSQSLATEMRLSVDESAGADIVVRVIGAVGDSDVPVLAETLGEVAERGRALILDLSSVTGVAAGVHSVLDATAIRLGRWNQQLTVVLSPALESEVGLVTDRVVVRRSVL